MFMIQGEKQRVGSVESTIKDFTCTENCRTGKFSNSKLQYHLCGVSHELYNFSKQWQTLLERTDTRMKLVVKGSQMIPQFAKQ